MILPVTLSAAAAAAVITLWLSLRCLPLRFQRKISIGDGGDKLLTTRMRAQANFAETAPFVLALIAAIELAGAGGVWLAWVAAIWVIGRLLHPFGMERPAPNAFRASGVLSTWLILLGLAIYAALIVMGVV